MVNSYLLSDLINNPGYLKASDKILKEQFGKFAPIAKELIKQIKTDFKTPYYGNPLNTLVIGDTHLPFERAGYLEHCKIVQILYDCGTIVHIGDVIDNHYSSYHESDPDGLSAGDELNLAKQKLKDWYKSFPEVFVCLGNHDEIPKRKLKTLGLSKNWIKDLNDVLEVPKWNFALEWDINNVIYTHGTGTSGENAAFNKALNRRRSIVSGHLHTVANIKYNVSERDKIFAMQVGCGIDDTKYAFEYAKGISKKSVISCGVVMNNGQLPLIIPMEL